MFKKLFNGQAKSITSAAVIIGAASLTSRLLGILRDRVLAGEFGAGATLDTYYAAFRIPDLIFNLLILGTLSAGFIPIFTSCLKKDKFSFFLGWREQHQAWRLVNNLLNVILFLLILIFGVLIIIAPLLMRMITPGFNQAQLNEVVALTRIMLLSPILLGISGIFGGILQSFKRFFVYSLSPIFYNVGIIIGALFLTKFYGIYGLAWGVVLGSLMHLLVQVPAIYALGYKYNWLVDLSDRGMFQIFKMMVPRTLGLAISQINLLIVTIIGSMLSAGSITIFNFANNIQSFPMGIFGISFAIAAFPTFSEQVNDQKLFAESLSRTIRQILFFIIPSSVLIIILRAQVVRVILGSGQFDWNATVSTIDTLAFFTISIFAQSLIPLFTRAFYAFQDSKTPFYVGLVCTFINVILSGILSLFLDVAGLALAFSISSIINLAMLWMIFRARLESIDETDILMSTVKISAASFIMGIVVQAMKYVIEPYFGTQTFFGIFIQGLIAGLSGLLVYFILCLIFKTEEAFIFINAFKRKFLNKYKPTETIENT